MSLEENIVREELEELEAYFRSRASELNDFLPDRPRTPLMLAASLGKLESAKTLLKLGANPDQTDESGRNALMFAAKSGRVDLVKELLLCTKDLTARRIAFTGKLAGNVLNEAIGYSLEHKMVVDLLLEAGVDANVHSVTPLMWAADTACTPVIKALLDYGVSDQSFIDSALVMARNSKRASNAKLLISALDLKEAVYSPLQDISSQEFIELSGEKGHAEFNLPVESAVIDEARKLFGQELNEALLGFYRLSNGMKEGAVFEGRFQIVKLEDSMQSYASMIEISNNIGVRNNIISDIEIKTAWWDKAWFPFAEDGAGNYICTDMSPTEHGVAGQIIMFDHETRSPYLIADTLEEFFAVILAELNGELPW